ncbi:MAG: site-2 protease family protein [Anaerolineae bacterium]
MSGMIHWPPTWATVLLIPALLVAFTVHEVGHAVVAYLLGDTSQAERNRLTFNPWPHISWSGMFVYLLLGVGWAKPVKMDASRFRMRNKAFGAFLVILAGSTANLLLAGLALGALFVTGSVAMLASGASPQAILDFFLVQNPAPDLHGVVVALSSYMVSVNFVLGAFNLLPIPTLDGFQAVVSLIQATNMALRGPRQPTPAGRPAAQLSGADPSTPSPAQIHFDIALDYQREEQWDEAIARYRQALAHDETFDLAYYNLGLAYWAKGRRSLASSAFKAAMRTSLDVGLRIQSDLHLRKLAQVEEDPTIELGPPPAPLGLEARESPLLTEALPAVDRTMERRMWLSFALGGGMAIVLAFSAWVFVTAATVTLLA